MLKGPIKTNKNQSRTKKTLGKPKKPNISRSGDIGWLAGLADLGLVAGWPSLAGWLGLGWPAGWDWLACLAEQPWLAGWSASQPAPMSPDLEILGVFGFPKVFLVLDWFLFVFIGPFSILA